jgi:hypothetical protein
VGGGDAILSKTFNQSCDEIYGVETTFLSKSKGVFVSFLGILMALWEGQSTREARQVYMAKWCGGLSRQTSRCVNDEEYHVYYGM